MYIPVFQCGPWAPLKRACHFTSFLQIFLHTRPISSLLFSAWKSQLFQNRTQLQGTAIKPYWPVNSLWTTTPFYNFALLFFPLLFLLKSSNPLPCTAYHITQHTNIIVESYQMVWAQFVLLKSILTSCHLLIIHMSSTISWMSFPIIFLGI